MSLLQCCPTSDGAGAAILASEDFVIQHNLQALAVEIVAQAMATDAPKAFDTSAIELVGAEMTRLAAKQVFKKAGVTPNDIQVVELHDCFSANELVTYEALGLCEVGKAGEYIDKNQNTYGGKHVVNPSGGLISKGHPLGATGLAQTCEMVWQVRGWCGKRQVPNVKYALAHNVGLGGAVVVTVPFMMFFFFSMLNSCLDLQEGLQRPHCQPIGQPRLQRGRRVQDNHRPGK